MQDFLFYRLLDADQLNVALEEKGWYMYDFAEWRKDMVEYNFRISGEPEACNVEFIDFIYRPNHYKKNRISFQLKDTCKYNDYIQAILTNGFSFVRDKVYDRYNHILVHSDAVTTIEIIQSQSTYLYDANKYYNFAIYNTLEYEIVFAKEHQDENQQQNVSVDEGIGIK
ncbi:MAG: hypothetical protein KC414_11815 [Romboutsia sp.]|nr:hypothetical protein [Romboutsia sp.]